MGKLVTMLAVLLSCVSVSAQKKKGDEAAQELSNIVLKVVDDATGAPVERFSILCFRVIRERHGLIKGDRRQRYAGLHDGGTLVIQDLHRGENRLLVLPDEDSDYVPSGYLPVKVGKPGSKVTVRLRRAMQFRVRVVDAAGKPVAGIRVQLLQKLERSPRFPSTVHRIRHNSFRSSRWSNYLELAVGETDDSGTGRIPWQPWTERSVLRVTGAGYVMTEVDAPVIRPNMPPFTVRVPRGARLRGTAVPADQLAAFAVDLSGEEMSVGHDRLNPRIVLRNAATWDLHTGIDGRGYPIGPRGSFLCDSVPPGRWQVLFRYNKPMGWGVQTLPQSLAEVRLDVSKEKEVKVDLAPLMPTAVHGKVFLHGVIAQPESLGYDASWPNHRGEEKMFDVHHFFEGFTREGGGYRLRGLHPGNYLFSIAVRGSDGKPRMFYTLDRVRLLAGQDRELNLHFRHRMARVRLVEPDGTPVAGRVVRVGNYWPGSVLETNAEGWFTVDPVRARSLTVEVYRRGLDRKTVDSWQWGDPLLKKTVIGRVEINTARKVSEFKLIVPKGQ